NRSWRRFVKYGSVGLSLGALAGGLALPLAQFIYGSLLKGAGAGSAWQAVLIGVLCWLLFGGLIGFGEGVGKGTQSWKGLLGGVIGGLVGGLGYEINRAAGGAAKEPFRYQFFLALSLLLLGAAISAAIALVVDLLKAAEVEILDGKFAGRSYDVTKYVDPKLGSHRSGTIGSDQWGAQIFLPGDSEVLPRHAEIGYANGAPTLTVTPEASKRATTFINGRRLTLSTPLSDGDRLQFGSTKLLYRHKRR
ncbi:MAG: FHA domain-containing protein, partial [Pyrinomonadaceae bacterium]